MTAGARGESRSVAPRVSAAGRVEELGEGRRSRRLHRPGDDVGEIAGDAGAAFEQRVDQPLVGVDVAGDDVEQIVEAAAERPDGGDRVDAGDGGLEGLEVGGGVVAELDGDEDLDVGGDLRQRDLGAVAADDAGRLEAPQPLPEGRRRQVDLAGEVGLGDAALARRGRRGCGGRGRRASASGDGAEAGGPARGQRVGGDGGVLGAGAGEIGDGDRLGRGPAGDGSGDDGAELGRDAGGPEAGGDGRAQLAEGFGLGEAVADVAIGPGENGGVELVLLRPGRSPSR